MYQKPNGGWVIESYAGEKHRIMFGGPVMRHVNEIWGPEGSGPPTKNELIERVNKRVERYTNRLKKGDLFLIFSNDNEISFAERKAANLLPEVLEIMKSNLSTENKVNELISIGLVPRINRELCTYFVNNFFASSQLEDRINILREEIRKEYGADALRPVEKDVDLKIIKAKDEAMLNNIGIDKSDRGTAHSPDGPLIYAGCGYTYDDAFTNFSTEIQGVVDKVKDQDFNATIIEYKDTQYDSSCGTLTYENLKSLKYGDILYWASHGFKSTDGGELSFLYLKTAAQVFAWSNNDPLVAACQLVWEVTPGDTLYPWSPIAEPNWATTYWESILTQSKAIAILSCCYSYENGWAAACGGGVSFGYNISTTGPACEYNNEQLLGRMNGTIDGGQYRKAYEAYNHMPDHQRQFKIVPTTAEITLCPSPENYYPQDGSVVGETGTGYFEVDTYCHDNVPADEALTFATAGVVTISNVHWVVADDNKVKKIEFDWDGTGFFEVAVTVHHEKFHSWGATSGAYHLLDVDRIAPNTHDATYNFTSGVIDAALVLDRSGSMDGDKITQAKNASNQFVAMMNRGDNLAVCSFSSSASANFTITTVTSDSIKYLAQSAINAITTGGNTSIGSGMCCGQAELLGSPNPNYPQAMILLSDGKENTSPWVVDILPNIPDQTDIYTIGLGSDADGYLLNHIASQTGGFYSFSPSVYRLCEIFVTIMHKVSRRQQIALRGGTISSGKEEMIHDVLVDGSVQEAKFSLLWQDSANDLDLELITPDSIVIDSAYANSDPNITFSSFPAIEFFTVTYPDSGMWKIKVVGVDITGTEEYVVSVSGNTGIEIDIAFDDNNYIGNDTVNVTAELIEGGTPILGSDVFALIETPSTREKGSARELYEYKKNDFIPEKWFQEDNKYYSERGVDTLIFYDDGNHGDGIANDGIYGNYYTNTSLVGSYAAVSYTHLTLPTN